MERLRWGCRKTQQLPPPLTRDHNGVDGRYCLTLHRHHTFLRLRPSLPPPPLSAPSLPCLHGRSFAPPSASSVGTVAALPPWPQLRARAFPPPSSSLSLAHQATTVAAIAHRGVLRSKRVVHRRIQERNDLSTPSPLCPHRAATRLHGLEQRRCNMANGRYPPEVVHRGPG